MAPNARQGWSQAGRDATPRRERGTVLFLAMLLTLILAGLLMLEVQRTVIEISMVGNARFSKLAFYVTDGGLTATLAKAASDPEGFITFVEANDNKVRYSDLGINLFNESTDPTVAFGREGGTIGIVDFTTELQHLTDTNRVPGYSTSGNCFRRYIWTTTGTYGLAPEPGSAGEVSSAFRLSVRRSRTIGYLGPISCPL